MVALQLIVGPPVLGAEIDTFELGPVRREPKRNPNETAKLRWRIRRSIAGQVNLNRTVLEG
jgi:hypothetical protein